MANEEVLRLRATVMSDEALAGLRALRKEIGEVQKQGGKGAQQSAQGWAQLGNVIKEVGGKLIGTTTGLSGLGAAGVGAAAGMGIVAAAGYKLVATLSEVSTKIIALNNASKELGMGTDALKAFSTEAQKAGIAPEAMMQGLANFKRNTDDFSMRIGELRGQMVAMGAGPVLSRINSATTQLDKLKAAFDFKEVLDESDPSGVKSRRYFEMIGLGADATRLSWSELAATIKEKKILSPEDIAAAKSFNDSLISLGNTFDKLKERAAIDMFPGAQTTITELDSILKGLIKIDEWVESWIGKGDPMGKAVGKLNEWTGIDKFDPFGWKAQREAEDAAKKAGAPAAAPANDNLQKALQDRARQMREGGVGRAAGGPVNAGLRYTVGENGPEQFIPSMSGRIAPNSGSGPSESDASRIIKVGVFDALVDFKSYIESGAAASGQGGGGFKLASLGGSDGGLGGGGGGGGFGSSAYPNLGGGNSGGGNGNGQSAPRPGPGGQDAAQPPADPNAPASFNDRFAALTPGGAPSGANAGAGQAPVYGTGTGAGVPGSGSASAGGSGGITAPAGTAIAKKGLATITTSTGKKFQVDERFKANFQGFINDYEKAGGNLGPDTGTLGVRPHNASGHPIGAAIDINQIGYGVRSKSGRGNTLDVKTENDLAKKWGLVSGANWRKPDTGHFGIESPAKARQALIDNGVPPDEATAIANNQPATSGATSTASAGPVQDVPRDRNQKGVAAPIRYNNPGAQWPNADAKRFGMTDVGVIGGGNKIAGFPSPVHGAASNMDLLSKKYVGMTVGSAITKWSGSHRSTVPGYNPNTVITAEMAKDPSFMKPFFRTMQTAEAGKEWMSKEQLDQAYDMYRAGGAQQYADLQKQPNGQSTKVASADPNFVPQAPIGHTDLQQRLVEEGKKRALQEEGQRRIDAAVAPPPVSGNVNVTVNSNGTKADAAVKDTGNLYQKSSVVQHKQMQKTEEPASFNDRFAGAQ